MTWLNYPLRKGVDTPSITTIIITTNLPQVDQAYDKTLTGA
jgi:hypothetical protein